MRTFKLGEFLVSENLVSQEDLYKAELIQKESTKSLSQILVDLELADENELLTILSQRMGYQFTDQPAGFIDVSVHDIVQKDFVMTHKVLPLYIKNGSLYVATNNPFSYTVFEDLTMLTGMDTVPILSPLVKIEQAIGIAYSFGSDESKEEDNISLHDQQVMDRVDSAPVVKLVNTIVNNAKGLNASDIHIEPYENNTKIRFRVDGLLSDQMTINKDIHDLITTRIKIISGMNIAEKRIPQDGAFRIQSDAMHLDVRVSSIPTPQGEKVVLRLLGSDRNVSYDLSQIDISEKIKDQLRAIAHVPNGILLLTGPTGSGKTTTLYALLNEIATPQRSVVTIEDPIEKQFEGISQVQINPRAGLTFATGLRSILRQDPDVIMVGEIRDSETASIAIRAAITGHFVLSTLHTNDAIAAIARLVDMGVEPYMVASSVKAVLAQRLVRKLCVHCKYEVNTTGDDRRLLGDDSLLKTMKGGGCERCNQSGYQGRTAVFEIVFVDEKMQELISSGASAQDIKDYAVKKKSQFLQDDILRLVREGKTTVQEAKRILFSVD